METNTSRRLHQIMRDRNLRQVDILNLCKPYCKKYGVKLNKSDLSQYIAGKFSLKQDKLTILALALGVSEAWLMGYYEVEEKDFPLKETPKLSRTEERLLAYYRALNQDGQQKVDAYASDLTDMTKYQK